MLRFVTMFFAILVIGVSAGLYHVKYSFDRMERQAMALESEIAGEREAIRILEAEWSVLNRPGRLQSLTDRFLDLKPVEATQIVGFDDLPVHTDETNKFAGAAAAQEKPPVTVTNVSSNSGVTKQQ